MDFKFVRTLIGSIETKPIKNHGKNSRGRTQELEGTHIRLSSDIARSINLLTYLLTCLLT